MIINLSMGSLPSINRSRYRWYAHWCYYVALDGCGNGLVEESEHGAEGIELGGYFSFHLVTHSPSFPDNGFHYLEVPFLSAGHIEK